MINTTTIFPSAQTDILNQLLAQYYAHPPFDSTATASGTDTVTINSMSGIGVFSVDVNADSYQTFTINNSYIVAGSFVDVQLKYEPASTDLIVLGSYFTATGVLTVYAKNVDPSVNATRTIRISFTILT